MLGHYKVQFSQDNAIFNSWICFGMYKLHKQTFKKLSYNAILLNLELETFSFQGFCIPLHSTNGNCSSVAFKFWVHLWLKKNGQFIEKT